MNNSDTTPHWSELPVSEIYIAVEHQRYHVRDFLMIQELLGQKDSLRYLQYGAWDTEFFYFDAEKHLRNSDQKPRSGTRVTVFEFVWYYTGKLLHKIDARKHRELEQENLALKEKLDALTTWNKIDLGATIPKKEGMGIEIFRAGRANGSTNSHEPTHYRYTMANEPLETDKSFLAYWVYGDGSKIIFP